MRGGLGFGSRDTHTMFRRALAAALPLAARPLPLAATTVRFSKTVAPVGKNVGAARQLRPVPLALSHKNMDSMEPAPSPMSLDMKDPVLEYVPPSSAESVPASIPPPPPGFKWQWLDAVRSAALVPPRWLVWSGVGEAFGMTTERTVICAGATAPGQGSPHAVGLTITRYASAFTQSVVKSEPASLAQFLVSLHIRRAGPVTPMPASEGKPDGPDMAAAAKEFAARMQAQVDEGSGAADADTTPSGVPEDPGMLPTVLDTWQGELTPGVSLYGIEYTMAHSDLADPVRGKAGTHYYLALVLNSLENCVFEVEWRAPESEWQLWWNAFGVHVTDQLFLNWTDDSTTKFQ